MPRSLTLTSSKDSCDASLSTLFFSTMTRRREVDPGAPQHLSVGRASSLLTSNRLPQPATAHPSTPLRSTTSLRGSCLSSRLLSRCRRAGFDEEARSSTDLHKEGGRRTAPGCAAGARVATWLCVENIGAKERQERAKEPAAIVGGS